MLKSTLDFIQNELSNMLTSIPFNMYTKYSYAQKYNSLILKYLGISIKIFM